MGQIHIFRGMAAGLLAGCAAAWTMEQFQSLKARPKAPAGERPGNRDQPEEHLHQSETDIDANATVQTAQRISRRVMQRELTNTEKKLAGAAVHYGYASMIGSIYGGVAELFPSIAAGMGLPFGIALWVLGDEIAVPALGLGKNPTEYPPRAHADALAGHLMYGATTDVLRRVLRHVL